MIVLQHARGGEVFVNPATIVTAGWDQATGRTYLTFMGVKTAIWVRQTPEEIALLMEASKAPRTAYTHQNEDGDLEAVKGVTVTEVTA